MYRAEKCPQCGLSDGCDDIIVSTRIIDQTYNGDLITILEERRCDICGKLYKVKMHYNLGYEELER